MVTSSWNHNASCKTYEVDGIVLARIRRAPGRKPAAFLYTGEERSNGVPESITVCGLDLDELDRRCIAHAEAF